MIVTDVNRAKEIISGSFHFDCLESILTLMPYDDNCTYTGEVLNIDLAKISTEILTQIIVKDEEV